VWGDGGAVRNFTYVDDMVEAIYLLTQSDLEGAVNLGGEEYVTVAKLAQTVIEISGKDVGIEYVEGPVGVAALRAVAKFLQGPQPGAGLGGQGEPARGDRADAPLG